MPAPDLSVFSLVHEGLRGEFASLARASMAIRNDAHRELIEDQLVTCLELLTQHEKLETDWLFPTIRTRSPEAGPGLDGLIAEHHEMMEIIQLLQEPNVRIAEAAPLLTELHESLNAHIDREERDIVPFILNTITSDEWDGFSYQTLNSISDDQLPTVLGWLMRAGSAENVRGAKALLPTDVRVRLRLRWLPRYDRRVARLY